MAKCTGTVRPFPTFANGDTGGGITDVPSHLMPMSMRMFDILGQYAEDHCYLFFKYDYNVEGTPSCVKL